MRRSLLILTLLAVLLAGDIEFALAQGNNVAAGQVGGDIPKTCTISRNEVTSIPLPGGNQCPAVNQTANLDSAQAICCVFNAIYTVTMWLFWLLIVLAILFVLVGAFYILTAGGNTERVGTGRNFLIFAAIGFVLALGARAIPGVARAVVGL